MLELVSIIVPVFNSELYLEDTLYSILKQTYSEFELILVDDGSSDSSYTICLDYANRNPRVRVFKRPKNYPSGGNGARRFGFEQAQGKYVKWFDSDDVMLYDFIQDQVEYLEQHPNIDVVFSRCEIRNADLTDVLRDNWRELHDFSNLKSARKEYLLGKLAWPTPSGLWRKDSVIQIQPFTEDIKNSQEWLLHLQALIFSLKIATVNKKGFYVRVNDSGITASGRMSRGKKERLLYLFNMIIARRLALIVILKRFQIRMILPLLTHCSNLMKKESLKVNFFLLICFLIGNNLISKSLISHKNK